MADGSGVRSMIERLDGEKLRALEEARARKKEEERQRLLAENEREMHEQIRAEEERIRKEEEKLRQAEKWRVDEEASAREVAEMKKAFLEKNKPKKAVKPTQIKDIPTIVLDIGSNSVKCGYAGEDAPRVVISTVVGSVKNDHLMDLEKHKHVKDYYVGDDVWPFKDILTIKRTVERGTIKDFDDFNRILKHVFKEEMKIKDEDLKDHPIFVTEPPLNPKANREAIVNSLFKNFDVPALFVANTSSLALFSSGTLTGVVVDIGYGVATSVAIVDGEALPNTLKRLDVGGMDLDSYMVRLLNERGYRLNERSVFDQFLVRDIKERCCYVALDIDAEAKKVEGASSVKSSWAKGGNSIDVTYDVTDHGNNLMPGFDTKTVPDKMTIGVERFKVPEALFNTLDCLGKDHILGGVHKMVQETIRNVPMDYVRAMYGNIFLSGGTTLMKGFADRLRKELRTIAPPTVEINVVSTPNRHLAVWTGGSILASTKHFNYHWISRDEYEQFGVDLIHATR